MRETVSDRRPSIMFDVDHVYPGADPRKFTCSLGFYPDLRPAELFVHLVDGHDKSVNVDVVDASVAVSFALQHGAGLEDIRKAMLHGENGKPHGFLGEVIREAIKIVKEVQREGK